MTMFTMRLRALIEQRGIQQKDLACTCGFSSARLNNYIAGRTEPSLDVLVSICKALDVSSDYLLGLSDSTNASSVVTIPPTIQERDPFDDLTPDQRTVIEATLKTFRDANAVSASKKEA